MNPLLTLLASFFRHVFVTGLFWLVTLMSLPESFRSQVEDAANWVAPIAVSFVAWVVAKYGKPFLKKIGFLPCLAAFLALSSAMMVSCGNCITATGSKGGLAIQRTTCFDVEGKIVSQETKPLSFDPSQTNQGTQLGFSLTKPPIVEPSK